jgi:hypothetical protein
MAKKQDSSQLSDLTADECLSRLNVEPSEGLNSNDADMYLDVPDEWG